MQPVSLPEVDVDPLGNMMLDFLIDKDTEEGYVDFKESIDVGRNSPFAKLAKDIFAFSNYGGGTILVGFKERSRQGEGKSVVSGEKRNFLPVGLPNEYHVDQAALQEKFNTYVSSPMELRYTEFHRTIRDSERRFAAAYVPPSTTVLKPIRDGVYSERGKVRIAFRSGSVLIRRGTQSVVATVEEEARIRKRAETTEYRISILSGQPDRIQETLYSNLFGVLRLPELLWTAVTSQAPQAGWALVFAPWEDKIATLSDLSNPGLGPLDYLDPGSLQPESFSTWFSDPDKKLVIMQLLNEEVKAVAKRIGLVQEPQKLKFYYPCDGESRAETWKTRFGRSSTLTVAQRIWAQQLKKFVYWHVAVIARFTRFENRLFLRLSPTIQLTEDGKYAIFGQKEGTVITRLTYNRYNSSYLNSLLFWISKFAEGREKIDLANGAVEVSANPAEMTINAGIVFDKPVSEPIQEAPDIQIEEIA